ncbi:MAG: hypothetical protein WCF65_05995 [Parachlamydiaceae bacterium]
MTDRIYDEPATFEYFRKHAQQQKAAPPLATPPQAAATPLATPPQAAAPVPTSPQAAVLVRQPAIQEKAVGSLRTIPVEPPSIKKETDTKASLTLPSSTSESKSISAPPESKKIPLQTASGKTPFAIEPPPPPKAIELHDLRKIILEKLPHMQLLDNIPDDSEWKKTAIISSDKYKTAEVILLTLRDCAKVSSTSRQSQSPDAQVNFTQSLNDTPVNTAFLANIAKALEAYGTTALVCHAAKIEQEKGWEEFLKSDKLRLVIATSGCLYTLPEMQKYHREIQKTARHYLGNCPLLLLSDISFYLTEPPLKHSLWNAIKELLTPQRKSHE